ncbi:MAG: SHOCT domain-containing protein [Pseudomonadota bacterium]
MITIAHRFARSAALGLALAASLALAGCGGGGAESTTETTVTTTTKGQELQDLQSALDSGAITQEEFDAEKEKILDRE